MGRVAVTGIRHWGHIGPVESVTEGEAVDGKPSSSMGGGGTSRCVLGVGGAGWTEGRGTTEVESWSSEEYFSPFDTNMPADPVETMIIPRNRGRNRGRK
jgi:hypothetical protein